MRKLSLEEIEEIRRDPNGVDWEYISWYKNLSEDFIREFKDKVDWHYISMRQQLSEDFIREFQNEINWRLFSSYFSKEFCLEFYDKVNWKRIAKNNILYKGYFDNAPGYVKLYVALNYRELSKYL